MKTITVNLQLQFDDTIKDSIYAEQVAKNMVDIINDQLRQNSGWINPQLLPETITIAGVEDSINNIKGESDFDYNEESERRTFSAMQGGTDGG